MSSKEDTGEVKKRCCGVGRCECGGGNLIYQSVDPSSGRRTPQLAGEERIGGRVPGGKVPVFDVSVAVNHQTE